MTGRVDSIRSHRTLHLDRIWVEAAGGLLIAVVVWLAARLWTDPTDVAVIDTRLRSVEADVGEIKQDVREIRRAIAGRSTSFRREFPEENARP